MGEHVKKRTQPAQPVGSRAAGRPAGEQVRGGPPKTTIMGTFDGRKIPVYDMLWTLLAEFTASDEHELPFPPSSQDTAPGLRLARETLSEVQNSSMADFLKAQVRYDIALKSLGGAQKIKSLGEFLEARAKDALKEYAEVMVEYERVSGPVYAYQNGKALFDEEAIRQTATLLDRAAEILERLKIMVDRKE